jgi:pilus assembly protein CpaC
MQVFVLKGDSAMSKALKFFGAVTLAFSLNSYAQEDDAPVDNSYRTKQYINLTIGIEQDVKLPPLPPEVEFKGTFRRIVTAQYAKQMNVIRFIPQSEGFATLTIHDKKNNKIIAEYRIDIQRTKLDKVVKELRALLGDIEGISIKVVNNRVVIDGQVLLPKDLTRITGVVGQFGDQASSLVTLSPLAQKKIAEFIARDINNPDIEVRAVNDKIILSGEANDEDEKVRAEIIAKTYLPEMFVDPNEEKAGVKRRKPANDGVINLLTVKAAPAAPAK